MIRTRLAMAAMLGLGCWGGVAAADGQPTVYSSLTASFNNTGVSSYNTFQSGDLDGGGQSYSQDLLTKQPTLPGQTGTSLTPGGAFTHHGISFTWPSTAGSGNPDNTVAGGQTVLVSGTGSTLAFIGTSDYGETSGEGTINYTDGTHDTYVLDFPDWWTHGTPTGDIVTTTSAFWSTSQVLNNNAVAVYYAAVPVDPTKTVQSVTLPNISETAVKGTAAMHLFAMTLATAAPAGS
jgi:beta-glucosidase